jgi:hypothetical protein
MSPAAEAIAWLAVGGLCVLILGRSWGAWLIAPIGVVIAWPFVLPILALAPVWAWLLLLPIVPVFVVILALRGGQAVIAGIFGADAAAMVVARWILAILGSFGRGKKRAIQDPELPRPRVAPLFPHEFGGDR